jgi:HD-GYP domain-containing protein (c-di-GMP phosphodiesterase class II)
MLGIALAAERDGDRLIDLVLSGAKDLTNADGGTLYIRTDDDDLAVAARRSERLGENVGGTSGVAPTYPPIPLVLGTGASNHGDLAARAVHLGTTLHLPGDGLADAPDLLRRLDDQLGQRAVSVLTVPLKPRGGDAVGVLQLTNASDPVSGEAIPFAPDAVALAEALAAQAATALYNRELLLGQQRLFDAVVELVAGAIDAKSPYTGGHCERVPELALMLAEAADEETDGPLAPFHFRTEDEWREFRVGAWLHDCGKLTMPDHVIDKATKLEAVHNRLHEVRTRFEVLWRDAEIARLEAILSGGDAEAATRACAERQAQLVGDFAFVAACNEGGEGMADGDIARLHAIAGQQWARHFSDRIGLSHAERTRLAAVPEPPLPAWEPVLSNRPEHRVPWSAADRAAQADPRLTMKVPAYKQDLGELHNLAVRRGTLTEEDRFTVNGHIVQTIRMLETLPYPRSMRRVPEYAGTHHETMRGDGYPFGLGAGQLSVPARIMAVADIFEALTAADRPYKPPMRLSQAVEILDRFAADGHVDPEIVRLFLRHDLHRRYAERFLAPEQIDEVDVARYLRATPTPA